MFLTCSALQPFTLVITVGCGSVRHVVFLLVLCILSGIDLGAQPADPPADEPAEALERVLERSVLEDMETSEDTELLDELEGYRRRPMNLHVATADMLARLPGISLQDASAILDFVDSTAPIRIEELEAIETLDAGQLQILRSCTSLGFPRRSRSSPSISIRARFQQDLQPRAGYTDQLTRILPHRDHATGDSLGLDTISIGPSYLGTRAGYLTRIIAEHENFSGGFTFEKDQGEPFVHRDTTSFSYRRNEYIPSAIQPAGIDSRFGAFVSAHAAARLGGLEIHAGDYRAEFGQGLLFWSASGGSGGGEVIKAPYKTARGITAYRSANETSFFRGLALGWRPQNPGGHGLYAHLFWSRRLLDASLEEGTSPDGESVITIASIREDGYRRTRSELRRSGNLTEELFGGNTEFRFRGGAMGLTAYTSAYEAVSGTEEQQAPSFGGTTMISLDGRYARWGMQVFGEIAQSHDGTIGAIGGMAAGMRGIDVMIAGRWLPPSFATLHGSGFGESPLQQRNEHGIYMAAKTLLLPGLILSASFDLYELPEPSGLAPLPRDGTEGYIQLDYSLSPYVTLHALLKSELKETARTITDALGRDRRRMIDRTSTSGRLSVEYRTRDDALRLRTRIERRFIGYSPGAPASDGMLSFIDIRLRPFRPILLGARVILFDTDDFDSAIYEFEQELPGRMTGVALYGEGRRFYCYLHWTPFTGCSIALNYAETVFNDRGSISPGTLQEIAGPTTSSFGAQLDISF